MTCIEKLRELHPDWDDEKVEYYIGHSCPVREYIRRRPLSCGAYGWEDTNYDCEVCWDREVYENEDHNRHDIGLFLAGEDIRRLDSLTKRTGYSRDKAIQAALKIYEDALDTVEATRSWVTGFNMEVKSNG